MSNEPPGHEEGVEDEEQSDEKFNPWELEESEEIAEFAGAGSIRKIVCERVPSNGASEPPILLQRSR